MEMCPQQGEDPVAAALRNLIATMGGGPAIGASGDIRTAGGETSEPAICRLEREGDGCLEVGYSSNDDGAESITSLTLDTRSLLRDDSEVAQAMMRAERILDDKVAGMEMARGEHQDADGFHVELLGATTKLSVLRGVIQRIRQRQSGEPSKIEVKGSDAADLYRAIQMGRSSRSDS